MMKIITADKFQEKCVMYYAQILHSLGNLIFHNSPMNFWSLLSQIYREIN